MSSTYVDIIGSRLIGLSLSWALFGVLSVQTSVYSQAFFKDAIWTKILVYTVYILQTTQIILFTKDGFTEYTANSDNISASVQLKTSWFSVCVIQGLVAFSVQSFYAWRISIISGKKLPSVLIFLVSFVSFALSIVVAVTTKSETSFDDLLTDRILSRETTWQATAAMCDIIIAVCMTYYLRARAPNGEQFADTNKLVNRIVRLTIETGSLTASVAVITAILSAVSSHSFPAPLAIISNLYATTLLVVLNSRIKFKVGSLSWTTDKSNLQDNGNRSSVRFNENMLGGTSSRVSLAIETPPASEET
ncbi:hypothetical protein HYPSUDRAFT_166823 [Hypholoma sublateritium FD-334 SS-4]|uniref:DUF6534 domain-containing protein n=1 Tax=Hypholoma sublateritium (strain FD-334 SS-4) TaxID=945553 RepID=A0A0D2L1C2_HYPSF|nr:hypothetical protein HYPSUDRAFT_166823 [Hypholoma sublateritium FD-334 SS-4]